MSHVTKIQLKIDDLDCLEEAAEALGMELKRGQKTYKWYGKTVGAKVYPEGFSERDLGKCDHALVVKGNNKAYEIGVCKARDGSGGFELLQDFWSGGFGLEECVGKGGRDLQEEYVAARTTKQLRRQGYTVRAEQKQKVRV